MKKEIYCFAIKGIVRSRIKRKLHLAKNQNNEELILLYTNLLKLKKTTSLKKLIPHINTL